jgi:hypothetical protein
MRQSLTIEDWALEQLNKAALQKIKPTYHQPTQTAADDQTEYQA